MVFVTRCLLGLADGGRRRRLRLDSRHAVVQGPRWREPWGQHFATIGLSCRVARSVQGPGAPCRPERPAAPPHLCSRLCRCAALQPHLLPYSLPLRSQYKQLCNRLGREHHARGQRWARKAAGHQIFSCAEGQQAAASGHGGTGAYAQCTATDGWVGWVGIMHAAATARLWVWPPAAAGLATWGRHTAPRRAGHVGAGSQLLGAHLRGGAAAAQGARRTRRGAGMHARPVAGHMPAIGSRLQLLGAHAVGDGLHSQRLGPLDGQAECAAPHALAKHAQRARHAKENGVEVPAQREGRRAGGRITKAAQGQQRSRHIAAPTAGRVPPAPPARTARRGRPPRAPLTPQ